MILTTSEFIFLFMTSTSNTFLYYFNLVLHSTHPLTKGSENPLLLTAVKFLASLIRTWS